MTHNLPTTDIALYIWPGQWGLPSFDPMCLAAVLELQLAVPGKFRLVHCNSPDASPAGQLPSLVHGQHIIPSFRSIVKYVSGLPKSDSSKYIDANVDISLTTLQKSRLVAWCVHAESHLGDLVYYMLYSSPENWNGMMRSVLSSVVGSLQRFYVPERIRDLYKHRLEAAGLWSLPVVEEDEGKSFKQTPRRKKKNVDLSFRAAFEKEKVIEKAKSTFDIYARLLDAQKYAFTDRPTTLDVILAAHILVLLKAPFPNPSVRTLIQESYSSLEIHALRVQGDVFRESFTPLAEEIQHTAFWSLLPSWPTWRSIGRKPDDEEAVQWRKINWAFFGLVLGCFTAYAVIERQAFAQLLSSIQRHEDEGEEEYVEDHEGGPGTADVRAEYEVDD
ncbi:hypothetical protein BDQ17DRAFT_1341840 [Cyathus striatus]|nr:hypothetical protein BDQ17DRAFT_1341840 [Cyathus striatus]